MQYRYKCVPVPTEIETGKAGKANHATAIVAYEELVNTSAADGWELDRIDSISSVQPAGCLASLFGTKSQSVTFKILIFKKQI